MPRENTKVIFKFKMSYRWVIHTHKLYFCIEFLHKFLNRNKSITHKANELSVCGQVGRMQVIINLNEKFQHREKIFLLVDTYFILSTLFCLKNIH